MATHIGFANHAKTGGLSAGSSVAGLGATNLRSDQCSASTGWQTANGVTADAQLRCDAAIPGSWWRLFGLFNTNLTEDAAVTFTLWSGGVVVWTHTAPGPHAGYGQVVVVAPDTIAADFLQVQIDDPANPDHHISVGGAFFGPSWQLGVGMAWGSTTGYVTRDVRNQARGGQEYRRLLSQQRVWNAAFECISAAEAKDSLAELIRTAALGVNVLFVPDDTSADLYREAVFGTLETTADIGFGSRLLDAQSWSGKFLERK